MFLDRRAALGGLAGALAAPSLVRAQDFPARQIRLVVPFGAGGTTDFLARVVAEKMAELGAGRLLVENKAGGGGAIGLRDVGTSPPDGHSLVMTDTSISITPTLNPGAGVTAAMFQPVSLVGAFPSLMVIHPSVPARTVPEFIAYAKANPDKLNYGHGGVGTGPHLHGEMFNWRAGTKITAVAYRGNAPALADLLTGQIHVLFTGGPTAGAHVASGAVRLLATTGTERLAAFRDTPTSREQGFDFIAEQWFGVMTTAGVPAPVLARLNEWVTRAVADPAVSGRIAEQGGIPKPGAAAAFEAYIREQTTVWRDVIRAANISI